MDFLVTASKGLEGVVCGELESLGLRASTMFAGMVAFSGRPEDAWRACLWLRAGRRVLQPLGEFEASSATSLYEGVLDLPWEEFLTLKSTFAVEASVRDSAFNHSGFVALKVKDAIADRMRQHLGARPDVDRSDPDVGIFVHIAGTRASVSLDVSGGPLHKRGYRTKSVSAPLNETLAAGILLLGGYDGSVPFVDPFCGSGTLLIEAALIAGKTAPGLLRSAQLPFGFQRWPGFNAKAWKDLAEEAELARCRPARSITGSDVDPAAVRAADANAEMACVGRWVKTRRADAREFAPPKGEPGLIATNPPYGDHAGAGDDLPALYRAFGDALKHRCAGWRALLLTAEPALTKCIGLRPQRRIPLFNGPTPCKLVEFKMYEGSRKGTGPRVHAPTSPWDQESTGPRDHESTSPRDQEPADQ